MASLLAVPANEGMRSARLGGTGSLGHRRAPGACRPVGNGWVGHIAIAGRRPRSGASRRRASLSRPCTSQQGWPRSVVWVSSQRKLAEHRAAVPQLRQASLAGGSACAVEALPSSQTASHSGTRAGTSSPGSASRDPVVGGKSRTKTLAPENACGFVELIPRLYHLTKGSSWEHSGGRLERFLNTFGTEIVDQKPSRTRFCS